MKSSACFDCTQMSTAHILPVLSVAVGARLVRDYICTVFPLSILNIDGIILINREAPLEWMQLCLLSHGAQLGWEGPSSPFPMTEESITHQIIDRPVQGTKSSKSFLLIVAINVTLHFTYTNRFALLRSTIKEQGVRATPMGLRFHKRSNPTAGTSHPDSRHLSAHLTPPLLGYRFSSVILIVLGG